MSAQDFPSEEYKDSRVLREFYWEEGLSARQLSKKFSVSEPIILYWMKKFGIERRDKSRRVYTKYPKELLEKLYINQ